MNKRRGFTLIEVMITLAIIVIVTAVYFLAANPGGQLASSRNTKRQSDLQSIFLGIRENISDQGNGKFSCASGSIPTSTKRMMSGAGGYNIAPCIVITNGAYGLFNLPFDPSATGTHYASNSDYDTGYSIVMNSSTGQITLSAPFAELGKSISITQ